MQLPATRPADDPVALWALQQKLLLEAEAILGPRDKSKELYQPAFHDNGPHVRNTPNMDGAFAELSRHAEGSWPHALYQLAHETVHLLNPIAGNTIFMEEGVAVEFSMYIQAQYCQPVFEPDGAYKEAVELVRKLPNGVFPSARLIRQTFGSLGIATYEKLAELFANADHALLVRLSENWSPR